MRAFTPSFAADGRCGFGKCFAFGQQARTQQVDSKIAVAGLEPGGLAEFLHGLQAKKCVAFDAPTALAAEQAGENVSDGVDIGRNVKTPPEQVVAGVDDQRKFFWRDNPAQAVDELGAAGAAGEDADHAALVSAAKPSRSRADLSFSESSPGFNVRAGRNSG